MASLSPNRSVAEQLGHTEYIPASQLRVDASYQRVDEINWPLVREIATNPDPNLLQTITVARRADGSNYIVDGQHRWLGCKETNAEFTMPCRVLVSRGRAWEADLYNKLNFRRLNPRASGRYKAALVAGVEYGWDNEVAVRDLLAELDIIYDPKVISAISRGERGSPVLRAIGTVLRLHATYPDLLIAALRTLRMAWGEEHYGAYDVELISGMTMFYAAHLAEVNEADVVRSLASRTTPHEVVENAQVLRGNHTYSIAACVARVLAETHNRHRASGRARDLTPRHYMAAMQAYRSRRAWASMGPEERQAAITRATQNLTPEGREQGTVASAAKRVMRNLTPEDRERRRQQALAMTARKRERKAADLAG